MALSDPQSITVSGTASSLPRTGSGATSGVFSTPDGGLVLTVSHQSSKRYRRSARLTSSKIVPDALQPNVNTPVSASVFIVADVPKMGFSVAEQVALVAALAKWLTDTTNANTTRLLGGES